MRENPRVCIEADDFTNHYQWESVIVVGHYEELPDTPEYSRKRSQAYEKLQERAMWWQPAYVAKPHRNAADSLVPVYYRIRIDQVTGHRAMPDSVAEDSPGSETDTKSENWLLSLLRRARIIKQ